ncbi:MAG: bifunctional precorrin-2 dehydrogenase/sirohydrochlorin ferrochelatase [Thermoplasmatales archaeon]|nr:bifunctional precorrin-2 dehydrogenase/sirohydrochlorin ferrochelatase [Thermoplasmatales archaeon]
MTGEKDTGSAGVREPGFVPLLLLSEKQDILVVGGGKASEIKVRGLMESGSRITVVSPAVTDYLKERSSEGSISLISRNFSVSDLDNRTIVIASTSDTDLNSRIGELCKRKGILFSSVSSWEEGDFIIPANIRKGPLIVSVSTSGNFPKFAGRIRDLVSESINKHAGELLMQMGRLRENAISTLNGSKRSEALEIIDSMFSKILTSGADIATVAREAQAMIDSLNKENGGEEK